VAANCEKAIEEAAQQAQYLPDKVVVGIAGELVKGKTITVKNIRRKPETQITLNELQDIVNQVQAEAFRQARAELAMETGHEEIDIRLINAAVVSVQIDGYKVSNPLSYQGKELAVGVYSSFAPIIQLAALETIVAELNLELLAITAEPYAVSRCLNEESTDFSALFIDIGGGTTDVAVVRNGGVEGTRMYAIGGRAFTKRVATVLGLSFAEAEKAKLQYASSELEKEKSDKVRLALESDTKVWLSGLQIALEEFGESDLLPSKILLCGGGSNLPEIKKVLSTESWTRDLPFARQPEVHFIRPENVANMIDQTKSLKDISEVTPMALANVALDLVGQGSTLEVLMRRAVAGLKQ